LTSIEAFEFRRSQIVNQGRILGHAAAHHKIHAPLGHDAFLVQRDPQTEMIRDFLG